MRSNVKNVAAQVLAWAGLILAWQAGLLLTRVLGLPLPGTLTGMALLLTVLAFRPWAAARLEPAVRPLLLIMPLLFVPAGAKIVALAPRLAASWLPIAAVVVFSTILALLVTAWTVLGVARWAGKRGEA